MKYKIVGFTELRGEEWDCEAIDEKGKSIIVDPFVGCAWEYKNRKALLGTWFETKDEHWHKDYNVLMPGENDFKIIQRT